MSDKIVKKIMFYDEAQKAWVVDMMEMENNDQELMSQGSIQENQQEGECSYA
jgi:hypothetical protein